MQRYQAYAATQAGARSAAASVSVVLASDGVTPATIYSDNLVNPTPKASTFDADSNGFFTFYAKNGRYSVVVSGGTPAISPAITFSDILLYDPLDEVGTGYSVGQIVDIRAWGAKCDGVTDDTAAFRAALAALNSVDGAILQLPANSTILVSGELSFTAPNVRVQGCGPTTVVQTTVGNINLFNTAGYAGIEFRDFAVTCNAGYTAGTPFLVSAGSDDCILRNMTLSNFGEGVYATTAARLRVLNCNLTVLTGHGDAIRLTYSDDAVISQCWGTGGNSFVGVVGSTNALIEECVWTGSGSNVVSITQDSGAGKTSFFWAIVGCYFGDCNQGVTVGEECHSGEIADTIVSGSTATFGIGIELLGAQFCRIHDNLFRNCVTNGIHVENASSADSTWSNFNQFTGNYCIGNGQDGIYTQNHNGNLFEGNYCVGNGRHGINISSGSDIDVVGNTCRNNGTVDATGCGISVASTARAKIVGNTTTRLDFTGLTLGAQKYGILVDSGCSSGLLDGNFCHGNTTANLLNNGSSMVVGTNLTS